MLFLLLLLLIFNCRFNLLCIFTGNVNSLWKTNTFSALPIVRWKNVGEKSLFFSLGFFASGDVLSLRSLLIAELD